MAKPVTRASTPKFYVYHVDAGIIVLSGVSKTAAREFARTDRIVVRVPVYGPGGATPPLKVHILNRAGNAMSELPVAPSAKPGEQQIELGVAALPPGAYVLEITTGDQDGDAQELVGFRIAG